MANSEDPDEMTHVAAFQQGLRCLLIKLQRKKFIIFIKIKTGHPSIYILDHHDPTVLLFMENSIGLKRFNNHTQPFEHSQNQQCKPRF